MIDLNAMASVAVKSIEDSNDLQESVNKHVKKALEDEINSAFAYSSDFRKSVREEINKHLGFNPEEFDFAMFNQNIANAVKSKLNHFFNEEIKAEIEECIGKLVEVPPKSIKLSELIREYIDDTKSGDYNNEYNEDNHITLIIEKNDRDFIYISLDKEEGKRRYECEVRLTIYKNEISSIHLGGSDINQGIFVGPKYGFEKLLFQLHVMKSKIEIDHISEEMLYYPENDAEEYY